MQEMGKDEYTEDTSLALTWLQKKPFLHTFKYLPLKNFKIQGY